LVGALMGALVGASVDVDVDVDAVGAVDVGAVDVGAVDVDAVDVGPWWGWARGGGVRPPGAGSWGIQHQHQLLWVGGASTGAWGRLERRFLAAGSTGSSSGSGLFLFQFRRCRASSQHGRWQLQRAAEPASSGLGVQRNQAPTGAGVKH
jgi:hypothetical protein